MPLARNADSSFFAVAFGSTPLRSANRWVVGRTRSPNTGVSVACDVQTPAMNSGVASESTPMTVRTRRLPVCGSRTATLTGVKTLSSR